MKRRSLSVSAVTGERLDDLAKMLREDLNGNASHSDIVSALIFAAPCEPASLSRLVRLGRMERITDEGGTPDATAMFQCENTAHALGWRG